MNDNQDVKVVEEKANGGYRIFYIAKNARGLRVKRTFFYNTSHSNERKREMIDESLLRNVMRKKIVGEKSTHVLWAKKPYELKSELVHLINKMAKSNRKGEHMKTYGFGCREEEKREISDEEPRGENHQDEEFPRKSIFASEMESANTKVFLAPSFSGKTTLMVDQLNKLTGKELEEYDLILLFTESTSAAPLKKISNQVRAKMLILDRFVPQFVKTLKKINTAVGNRYRFLLLLDDCLNLKGETLIKMVLTLRNSNISTVISIQYSKLLSKSQRQSIHDYYLINMKLEDLEYLMSGFLSSHFRDLFEREGGNREEINKMTYKKLAEKGMERLKNKVLHFNQRKDEITIYNRPHR